MDKYYVFIYGEDGLSVYEHSKESIEGFLSEVQEGDYGELVFVNSYEELEAGDCCGSACMIIKGSAVIPSKKEVVVRYELD